MKKKCVLMITCMLSISGDISKCTPAKKKKNI